MISAGHANALTVKEDFFGKHSWIAHVAYKGIVDRNSRDLAQFIYDCAKTEGKFGYFQSNSQKCIFAKNADFILHNWRTFDATKI